MIFRIFEYLIFLCVKLQYISNNNFCKYNIINLLNITQKSLLKGEIMVNDKLLIVFLVIFLFIGGYIYTINTSGEIEPLGRLAFVKFQDPDMYPGH